MLIINLPVKRRKDRVSSVEDMKMRKMILIAVALWVSGLASVSTQAQDCPTPKNKQAVLYGANGKPALGQEEIFAKLAAALYQRGWGINISAGRTLSSWYERDKSGSLLFQTDPYADALDRVGLTLPLRQVGDGSRAEFLRILENTVGDLGACDELFVAFLTHGEPAGAHDSAVHTILTADDEGRDASWTSVADPSLLAILKSARDRGVKVGVFDSSCFSGGSIEPLSEVGCVLSTSTRSQVTWTTDSVFDTFSHLLPASSESTPVSLADLYEDMLRVTEKNHPQMSGMWMVEPPIPTDLNKDEYQREYLQFSGVSRELFEFLQLDQVPVEDAQIQEANVIFGGHFKSSAEIVQFLNDGSDAIHLAFSKMNRIQFEPYSQNPSQSEIHERRQRLLEQQSSVEALTQSFTAPENELKYLLYHRHPERVPTACKEFVF